MTNAQLAKDLQFWVHKIRSTKPEALNSQQIQNNEKQLQCSKRDGSIHCFGFSDFEFNLAPICFGSRGFFRASHFGFTLVELKHLTNQMAAIKTLLQAEEEVSHA
ncbi:MAG: hypothetical protein ACXWWP_07255 [Candidatus Binatia bacterium]